MIEAFLLALLVAKIRKYRLAPLFREWPVYLVIILALIHLYMNFSIFQGNMDIIKYSSVIRIAFALIFGILIFKYNLYKAGFLGVAFIALGGILNNIVMKANGGRMPVFPSISYITGYINPETFKNMEKYDDIHIQGSSSTKLAILADKIDLGYTMLSIGDVFIVSIVFLTIY
ncbi:MAG: hypothetical protein FIA99_15450, partial [Ruminiclostridium sp.]|nr:hypothetical protein [Ruminiclostridium sp.]